jgi:hypothetical protein
VLATIDGVLTHHSCMRVHGTVRGLWAQRARILTSMLSLLLCIRVLYQVTGTKSIRSLHELHVYPFGFGAYYDGFGGPIQERICEGQADNSFLTTSLSHGSWHWPAPSGGGLVLSCLLALTDRYHNDTKTPTCQRHHAALATPFGNQEFPEAI